MARYTGPKAKKCRQLGVNLFGSPKYTRILTKRPTPPGQIAKRMGKKSEYALQLREKQKLRYMFGLLEKQFKKYFDKATRMAGVTADNMMGQLERRLDNVIYRSGFALTRFQSRQFASHGHFLVNGRRVTIPSYQVKVGDTIELRSSSQKSKVFIDIKEENESYEPPRWLNVDLKKNSFVVEAFPGSQDYDQLIDMQLIVEFYSR